MDDGIWVTEGNQDVVNIVFCNDSKLYFTRAEDNGIERHIYEVGTDGRGLRSLIDDIDTTEFLKSNVKLPFDNIEKGFYDVDISPKGEYYRLSYEGPHFPWEAVLETKSAKLISILKTCDSERKILEYDIPTSEYIKIPNGEGDLMNAIMLYPPRFDKSKKYPVMMQVYGGPESQTVDKQYGYNFMHTITLKGLISVLVDGRGTNFKGRKFMTQVAKNLGHFEAIDQISAVKYLSKLPYIDPTNIGIWGWSYGGYLTAKVIELSNLFKLGISVAPVTSWYNYDSFYTERFMKLPKDNKRGYEKSKVDDMKNFLTTKYLLVHGTTDSKIVNS